MRRAEEGLAPFTTTFPHPLAATVVGSRQFSPSIAAIRSPSSLEEGVKYLLPQAPSGEEAAVAPAALGQELRIRSSQAAAGVGASPAMALAKAVTAGAPAWALVRLAVARPPELGVVLASAAQLAAMAFGTAQAGGVATVALEEATTQRLAGQATVAVTAAEAPMKQVPAAAEAMAGEAAAPTFPARVGDREVVAEAAALAPPVPRTPFRRMAEVRPLRAATGP